jgi:type I restriction enzyme S subunit
VSIRLIEIGESNLKIADGNYSAKYPRSDEFVSSGIPFIRANNFYNKGIVDKDVYYLTPEKHAELKKGHLKPRDVLITTRGNIGQVAIVPNRHDDSNINAQIVLLRCNDGWHPEYLLHVLTSDFVTRQLPSLTTGTALKQLPVKNLKKIKVPLPPLPEQIKIADILDAADSIRQKDQQLIEYYDCLSQSLFLDMFGDSVANSKEWEVNKLKDLSVKIHSGNTPKGGSKVYVDKGVAFFRSQNVWKNRLKLDDIVYIDKETHSKMRKSSLKYHDILMTKTGRINTENSSLGRAAMFLGEDDTANVNGHVYLIRLKENVINEFVLFILTSIEYRDYIRSVCVGGIDKRQLNKDHLENFPIISPPRDLQEKFVEQLKLITKQKELAQQGLKKSDDLFNSLLQKAFKGGLTVS